MAFRSGDIVYFKECRNGSRPKKSQGARFKGHGIGMFLGHVGPFEKDPSGEDCIKLVGACGFLTFDDVAEFLGDEQAKLCVDRYEKKYYTEKAPEVKSGSESILVSVDGKTPIGEGEKAEPRLLLNPRDQAALDKLRATRRAGETVPLLTVADIQKQIKALSPEQIRKALTDARSNAQSQLGRPLADAEVADINAKVCGALGVDPTTLERLGSSGPAEKETAPSTETAPESPQAEQDEENPFALARREGFPNPRDGEHT